MTRRRMGHIGLRACSATPFLSKKCRVDDGPTLFVSTVVGHRHNEARGREPGQEPTPTGCSLP